MNRKDIPNLIEKHVYTQYLTATKWNGQFGWVVGWNEERERFVVKMDRDGSIKLFKPYNLCYAPIPQNEKEKKLGKLVRANKLVDFEQGMELFDQLSKKYMLIWLKVTWLKNLWNGESQQDKRYIPKIQAALENIIETSQFQDLVVTAKIELAHILSWKGNVEQVTDLCMSCIGAHYGHLPELFNFLRPTTGMQDNFEIVRRTYLQSKRMIENKTCGNCDLAMFIDASTNFLTFCKNHNLNTAEECIFLRKTLASCESSGNYLLAIGRIYMLEENYEEAIRNVQIHQESISSATGNVNMISISYGIKVHCYIKLGNKSMAKKSIT